MEQINPLNAELNPICHLLALLGTHHILHGSRIRVNASEDADDFRRLSLSGSEPYITSATALKVIVSLYK